MPSGESPKRFMIRSDNEPWLVPIRIATPSSFARRTSGEKVSWSRVSSAS